MSIAEYKNHRLIPEYGHIAIYGITIDSNGQRRYINVFSTKDLASAIRWVDAVTAYIEKYKKERRL